jgi:hypothetical protein
MNERRVSRIASAVSLAVCCLLVAGGLGWATRQARAESLTLRKDQVLYWYGRCVTSPFQVAARGDSIALNDAPDLGGPRALTAEVLAELPKYRRSPYARQLMAHGLPGGTVIAMTDSAVCANATHMVTACHRAKRAGRDGDVAAREVADSLIVDLSRTIQVQGPTVLFYIRGLGPINLMSQEAGTTASPAVSSASQELPVATSAERRLEMLRGFLREPGRKVIFVFLGGYAVYTGPMATRALAEVDSTKRGLLVPDRARGTLVPPSVLEGLRPTGMRRR